MRKSRGLFFDGRSAKGQPVELEWDRESLHISGADGSKVFSREDLQVSADLGSISRWIYLPQGMSCEVRDAAFADALSPPRLHNRILRAFESRIGLSMIAAALLLASMTWVLTRGMPFLADFASQRLPDETRAAAGEVALLAINQLAGPTALGTAQQANLAALFSRVKEAAGKPNATLHLREGRVIGANAMAIPGDRLIITDQMVHLAQDEDELFGVMAHEFGHFEYRHSIRMLFISTGITIAMTVLLGDISALVDQAGGLPVVLIYNGYSRKFEQEADAYATELMRNSGIAPWHLSMLLSRVTEETESELDYLSSHPATRKRIRAIGCPPFSVSAKLPATNLLRASCITSEKSTSSAALPGN